MRKKEEERCWICRRNKNEAIKDFETFRIEVGCKDTDVFEKVNLWDSKQNVYICQGCSHIIYCLNHPDLKTDQDFVTFEDLKDLKIKIVDE